MEKIKAVTVPSNENLDFEDNKDMMSGAPVVKTFVPARSHRKAGVWNSLEAARIFVGALTPLLIAFITVYVTTTLHRQDEQRQAREGIRARKAAVLTLTLDFKESINDLIQKSDSLRDRAYFYKFSTEHTRDGVVALEDSHAILAAFRKKGNDDWSRLEPIVDDRELYSSLYRIYTQRIVGRYLPELQACANAAIVISHVAPMSAPQQQNLMQRCPSQEVDQRLTECSDYLMRRIGNFDRPATDFESGDSVCPAKNPAP